MLGKSDKRAKKRGRSDTISKAAIAKIIRDLHWMARRYADGRSSYAPCLFNDHVRELLKFGFDLKQPLYARDGMGRNFDHLSADDVAAAEADNPGVADNHEVEERLQAAIRDAVAAERAACTPAVEDIARAWASIDGKRDEFDASKERDAIEYGCGCYGGYMFEAEELLKRAAKYAEKRRNPECQR